MNQVGGTLCWRFVPLWDNLVLTSLTLGNDHYGKKAVQK